MEDEPIRVEPPLYLASTSIRCWRCGAEMLAVALIGQRNNFSVISGPVVGQEPPLFGSSGPESTGP